MKTTIIPMASAALLWSGLAVADPFVDCQDAANYGYNQAAFYVSAIYNRANCDRVRTSLYENFVFDVIPTYWAAESAETTPEKAACMLQGSFEGWMDTTLGEYDDCVVDGKAGFDAIQRRLLGMVAGPLLLAFYSESPALEPALVYYTPDVVAKSFAYDFIAWPLIGTVEECETQIDVEIPSSAGVPWDLVGALKLAVCK